MSKVNQLKINFHFPFHYISRIFRFSQKTVFRVSGKFLPNFSISISRQFWMIQKRFCLTSILDMVDLDICRGGKRQIEGHSLYSICTVAIHSFTPGLKRWKISVLLTKESHPPSFLSFVVLWDADRPFLSSEKGWKSQQHKLLNADEKQGKYGARPTFHEFLLRSTFPGHVFARDAGD